MSTHITRRLGRALPLAAAALLIHIGSAAAASPQGAIQDQMREVLSGSIATHAIPRSEADPASAVRSNIDAQASVRQFLLGWNVSHAASAEATRQKQQAEVSESGRQPQADEDFQSAVQRSLLGESASSRGAL